MIDDKLDNLHKLIDQGKSCKNCGRAIVYQNTVVCGTWHKTFSKNSLCEEFETPKQVKEKNKKNYMDMVAKKKAKEKFNTKYYKDKNTKY